MEIEKERLSKNFLLPKWIWLEHNARYNFVQKFTKNKTIIDCACGSGVGTNLFSEKALSLNAFDISETALTEARKRCNKDNVLFEIASGENLPLKDDSADLYISLETIEHIEADKNFLKEVLRVLKSGGSFICSTPNRRVTNPGKKITEKPANIFHVREYTEQEFLGLLEKYFDKIEIFGQNPNLSKKTTFLNFLGRILPLNMATRIHQALKLVTHLFRKNSYYMVQEKQPGFEYEYLTVICLKK